MIVVDTNVVVATVLSGDDTCNNVLRLDSHWLAPSLLNLELRNALAGYIRMRGMSSSAAVATYRQATEIVEFGAPVLPETIFDLIQQSYCTAYDLEFVALAQSLDVPLVTFDRQLLDQFSDTAVHPVDFAA